MFATVLTGPDEGPATLARFTIDLSGDKVREFCFVPNDGATDEADGVLAENGQVPASSDSSIGSLAPRPTPG